MMSPRPPRGSPSSDGSIGDGEGGSDGEGGGDADARAVLARPLLASRSYPSLEGRFLSWADRTPQHIAVVHGDCAWTYRVLSDRARAIAAVLRQRSALATDAVAVIGQPSPGLVAAMLGTLMSGRVLVPLDAELPAARRAIMLREARVTDALVVGEVDDGLGSVDAHARPARLAIDPQTGELQTRVLRTGDIDAAVLSAAVTGCEGDGPAYVFYTSGTTGEPKGILGTRQGIAHFLHWQQRVVDVASSDRFSQLTGISFDVVLREMFLPLYSGATLVIPDAASLHAPLPWLRDQRITIVHTVPSRAEHWLRRAEPGGRMTCVRAVFFAGEPLTSQLVRRWRWLVPDGDIINLYGPTETTLAKCFHRVPDEVEPGAQPIGRPLPDTQVFILAGDGSPCARGQVGEIAVRTPFRTLGYLNAPAEQRARFIANPYRADAADLLYRTGDQGRVRPDGSLEIHGRMDRQVKIRGARVELGEIEAVLRRHSDVEQAVVAVSDDPVDRLIIGFVVLARSAAVQVDLRAFLRGQLPAWMVPSAIVAVDEMPLNRNGKTDKRALLALYAQRTAGRRRVEREPTPTEALVIDHVQQLLAIEGVRALDDFFRLGGGSRSAAQLAARLERQLGVALPAPLVFETPVIADLARALDQRSGRSSDFRNTERIEL